MWTIILGLISEPKNLLITILGLCLVCAIGYAGVKCLEVAAKERTIAGQAATLKLKEVEVQAQKAQIATMQNNIKGIEEAQLKMQKIAIANRKLKAQIAQLSEVKNDDKETQVYNDLFDFFTTGGVSNVPGDPAGTH